MRPVHIYALTDPKDGKIMYIGATAHIRNRFRGHLLEAFKDRPTTKNKWVRELLSSGNIPGLITLEVVDESVRDEKEREWIGKFNDLTNELSGGWGFTSSEAAAFGSNKPPMAVEQRVLVSEGLKRYYENHDSPMRGYKRTEEHIKRLQESRGKITPDMVIEIRDLYRTGKYKQREIAEMFSINQSNVGQIVNYKTWKNVK